jgi:hypothetical protein
MYRIISTNSNDLTSSFPICILYISFFCHAAQTKNSTIILSKSGEYGHPCIIPDFRGNGFRLFPLRAMMAIGLCT